MQDVVRSWYARLPSIVQNAEQLVTNAEECAEACRQGQSSPFLKLMNEVLPKRRYSQDLSNNKSSL